MTPRSLKIALAVSVALNLFAIVAGVTTVVTQARVDEKVEAQRRPGRSESPMQIVASLDPDVRDRVHDALRASALAARPDFEEARNARREAIEMAGAPTFDQAAVSALLDRSRTAEIRGRARIESGAIGVLATLEPDDRKALATILSRHGQRRVSRDRQPRAKAEAARDSQAN